MYYGLQPEISYFYLSYVIYCRQAVKQCRHKRCTSIILASLR